jgi:hypothetical protein
MGRADGCNFFGGGVAVQSSSAENYQIHSNCSIMFYDFTVYLVLVPYAVAHSTIRIDNSLFASKSSFEIAADGCGLFTCFTSRLNNRADLISVYLPWLLLKQAWHELPFIS